LGGADHYTLPDYLETTRVPAVAATFVMVRRDRFEAVGGFDERYFVFLEDTDLSLRLERLGHPNLFVPAAGGTHAWGHGSSAGRRRRAYFHQVSMWKYFWKHHAGAFSLLVLPLLLAANLMVTVVLPESWKSRTRH
jgi:GT2 family glycosyltransferase